MPIHATHSGMIIQVMPGEAPMRLIRTERATHNGRPCIVLHGIQSDGLGRTEPVEVWVGEGHTVREWKPTATVR